MHLIASTGLKQEPCGSPKVHSSTSSVGLVVNQGH